MHAEAATGASRQSNCLVAVRLIALCPTVLCVSVELVSPIRDVAVESGRGANPRGSGASGWSMRARAEEASGRRCLAPGFPDRPAAGAAAAVILSLWGLGIRTSGTHTDEHRAGRVAPCVGLGRASGIPVPLTILRRPRLAGEHKIYEPKITRFSKKPNSVRSSALR